MDYWVGHGLLTAAATERLADDFIDVHFSFQAPYTKRAGDLVTLSAIYGAFPPPSNRRYLNNRLVSFTLQELSLASAHSTILGGPELPIGDQEKEEEEPEQVDATAVLAATAARFASLSAKREAGTVRQFAEQAERKKRKG